MSTSSVISAGLRSRASASPSAPSAAVTTSKPSRVRNRRMRSRTVSSSSMTSTRLRAGRGHGLPGSVDAGSGRGRGRSSGVRGEPDGEARALGGRALDGDVAAHEAGELAADGEPEARAAVLPGGRRVRLRELLEQPAELLRRHADAGVGHGDGKPIVLARPFAPRLERDRAALGELARVAQKVEHDLAQANRVGPHPAEILGQPHLEPVAVLGRERLGRDEDVAQHGGHLDILDAELELAGLDLGQVEDLVDQLQQVPAGAVDAIERLEQLGAARPPRRRP